MALPHAVTISRRLASSRTHPCQRLPWEIANGRLPAARAARRMDREACLPPPRQARACQMIRAPKQNCPELIGVDQRRRLLAQLGSLRAKASSPRICLMHRRGSVHHRERLGA